MIEVVEEETKALVDGWTVLLRTYGTNYMDIDLPVDTGRATEDILYEVVGWVEENRPQIRCLYVYYDGDRAEKMMEACGFITNGDEYGGWVREIKPNHVESPKHPDSSGHLRSGSGGGGSGQAEAEGASGARAD